MVRIAKDKNLETHNIWIKVLRFFVIPIINNISPQTLQNFINKFSPFGKSVIEKPGTAHSLEEMYLKKNFHKKKWHPFFFADFFWNSVISQPKAIRNRLKIVQESLNKEIEGLLNKNRHIELLNIGGGSSRAIIQTAANYDGFDVVIKIINLDRDPKAIELGREIAKKYNLDKAFTWLNADVRNLDNLVSDNFFNIVEMVGLLDYFDNQESINLIEQIFKKIKEGGLFIVGNVFPNSEMNFVSNVGWPKMYYKNVQDMYNILISSGFKSDSIEIILDPLEVHMIVLARK